MLTNRPAEWPAARATGGGGGGNRMNFVWFRIISKKIEGSRRISTDEFQKTFENNSKGSRTISKNIRNSKKFGNSVEIPIRPNPSEEV